MSLPNLSDVRLRDPLPLHIRIMDTLLHSTMVLLGGSRRNSVQRTRKWHVVDINPDSIVRLLSVKVVGQDKSKVRKEGSIPGFFHMPIFGGWKDYAILKLWDEPVPKQWFIGWYSDNQAQLNKIPLRSNAVKMLTGPEGEVTNFFAVDIEGKALSMLVLDYGILGDQDHSHLLIL